MHGLYGSWKQWLRSKIHGNQGRLSRRLRKRETAAIYSVAAEVEQLESRELLTITFHGGALIPNVEAQNIFLGSDWSTNNALKTQSGNLDAFTSMFVQSKYMDMLTVAGYNVYRGTSSAGVNANLTLNKTTGITDAQIQTNIQSLVNSHKVQAPDANRLYIVYVEPGVLITQSDGSSSGTVFLGYHGAFHGTTATSTPIDIHYAVISYPGNPNFSYLSQGFVSSTNEMTVVTSHEISEAITDPNVSFATTIFSPFLGWYDSDINGENGDIAAGFYTTFQGYEVQQMAARNDSLLNPNGVSATLTPPKNLSLTNVSPTKGLLSWDSEPLAQGYRIFSVSGAVKTQIGLTNATTTTFQLNGLTPGAQLSFIVEAFDGTFKADSAVISGIAPFTSPVFLSQVKIASQPSTSAPATLQPVANLPIYVASIAPTGPTSTKPRNYYASGIVGKLLP